MKAPSEGIWIAAAVVCCLLGQKVSDVFAQNRPERNGWVVRHAGSADQVRFGIDRSEGGNRQIWTSDLPWTGFRGLSESELASFRGVHSFDLVRDAGKFVCTGEFSGGRGNGAYVFEPSKSFASDLERLGYPRPEPGELVNMAMSDISLSFATAIQAAGLNASIRELIDLRSHGLTTAYIQETHAAGFTGLSPKDFVEMKNNGVEPAFLRELKSAGYDFPVSDIVQLKNHGIDARYIREMARSGVKPGVRDLIEMKNNGVPPEFLRTLSDSGLADLDTKDIVEMRNHGVSAEFVRDAKAMGYAFTPGEIIEMRNHGIDSDYLRKLKDSGYNKLSVDKIVKLKTHGVD